MLHTRCSVERPPLHARSPVWCVNQLRQRCKSRQHFVYRQETIPAAQDIAGPSKGLPANVRAQDYAGHQHTAGQEDEGGI